MKILTASQMNEVDRLTSREFGLPSLLLMENAGLSLYRVLEEYCPELETQRVAIVCGKGNNGGDGLVLARQLVQRNIYPDVYLLSRVEQVQGDAAVNLEAYLRAGETVVEVTGKESWREVSPRFSQYHIIVDAILGTGISKPLRGLFSEVVSTINASPAFVLSVDIPSGMFSDSLTRAPQTVVADATVTFAVPKVAHILNEDQEALGDVHVVPIGTPAPLLENPDYYLQLMRQDRIQDWLPAREAHFHKGHFGHAAVVAGSRGKSGAAVLAATAALRTGAGLVTVCVPEAIQPEVASQKAELMTEGLPGTRKGTFATRAAPGVLKLLKDKDAAAIGPGLSREEETVAFVRRVVRQAPIPLVVDADALNAFQGQPAKLANRQGQPLVLTPHPGEFSRLCGRPTEEVLAHKVSLAREFARRQAVWLVLKSFRTLVAEPAGEVFVCPLGNPGMATAGMGDVLTGVLAALLGTLSAQATVTPEHVTRAVLLGVYLHALAGDLAEVERGPEALTAGDVISRLGAAYRTLADGDVETEQ